MQQDTLESLFLKQQDPAVLEAAEAFAQWTLPTVFTKDWSGLDGKRASLRRDFQSYGAVLLNNAAAKVTQALFPENISFFRIQDTEGMQQLFGPLDSENPVQSIFSTLEAKACSHVFLNAGYASKNQAVKLLLITGNALEYRDPVTKKSYVYNVRQYTVKRDGAGTVMQIILRERVAYADLPDEFKQAAGNDKRDPYSDVTIFTGVFRERTSDGNVVYKVRQEAEGKSIGEESTYPEMLCPYTVLTWNLVNGEHYGRGLVEDYAGGFARLSELSMAHTLYEIEAMRLIHLVKAGIDVDEFQAAGTGEHVQTSGTQGDPGVWAYEGGTYQKMQVLGQEIQQLFGELARAFMYTGNTRDAERVTATEIRQNIAEAQNTLGDAYSNLAEVWHQRLAYLLLVEVEPRIYPSLVAQDVRLDVVVGTAALNRAAQVDKLLEATLMIQQILPVLVQASKRFNGDAVIDSILAGYGINRSELSYTKAELKTMAEQEQAIQAQQQQNLQAAANNPELAAQQLGQI